MKLSGKVLVAETKDIDAAHLKLMLEKNGCKTEIVKKGSDVLQKLEQEDYALLLLNETLPGIDSTEIVKKIRSVEKTTGKHLPIIGITAYSLPSEKKQFQDAGIDYCLSKPVYKNLLYAVLSEVTLRKPFPQ